MNITKDIEKLGLNNNQIQVYLTLLQIGSGSIQEISRKSRIKRTTVYSILDALIQRNLVTLIKKDAHREYTAEDPKKIPSLIDQQIGKMQKNKEDLSLIIPELASIYNANIKKPKIKYYEGVEGLKLLFEETLELKKGEEILAFSSAQLVHEYMEDYITDYISRRAKKGITQRCIVEDSPEAKRHQENDVKELRETRLINRDTFPFSNEINIFGNKIFILSYRDLLGVLIESSEIAKTQKAIFELAWIGAEKIGRFKKSETRKLSDEDNEENYWSIKQ